MESEDWEQLMKKEILASLGNITLPRRNMILFSGQSMAGKTISCLHLAKSAIEKGFKVLYFDTEEKSILKRAEPNLFNRFYSEQPIAFKNLFNYRSNLETWAEDIKDIKPDMIIIDSLYQPFFNEYPQAMRRAIAIKEFLTEFRAVIWEMDIGAIITVPTGKVVNPEDGIAKNVPLGGEGVKYLADVKVMIQFSKKGDCEDGVGENRFFYVDRNATYAFEIGEGGTLTQI